MSIQNGVQSPPPYDITETAQTIGKRKRPEGLEEAQSVNGAGERHNVSERSEGRFGALLLDVFEVMKRYAQLVLDAKSYRGLRIVKHPLVWLTSHV